MINTDDIKVGDTFSTYTKLVTALGLESCKGKQRVYQKKEIRRYIDFEKTGKINPKTHKESNEIIVTKIYDEPLEKEDKESLFTKPMKSFIYNYYVNKKNRHIIKTSTGIMYDMDIIKSTQDIYTQKDDTTSVKIYKFQLRRLFNRHLEYALSSLERDEKIEYRHTYRLKEHEGQEFYEWSVADRKQTEAIKKIEADCRKEYEQTYNRSFNSIWKGIFIMTTSKENIKENNKPTYTKESKFFVCKTPRLCKYLQELGFTFNKCIPDRKNPFFNVWIFTNSDDLYQVVSDYFVNRKYDK